MHRKEREKDLSSRRPACDLRCVGSAHGIHSDVEHCCVAGGHLIHGNGRGLLDGLQNVVDVASGIGSARCAECAVGGQAEELQLGSSHLHRTLCSDVGSVGDRTVLNVDRKYWLGSTVNFCKNCHDFLLNV